MTDHRYKYIALNSGFTSMAGNLDFSLETLKRSLNGKDSKKIMLEAANVYDLTKEFLRTSKKFLESVMLDAKSISEATEIRNTIDMQSEVLLEYMNRDNFDELKCYQDMLDKNRSYRPI